MKGKKLEGIDCNKSNINEKRRKLVQAGWITPIVSVITLPTHAQTSVTTPTPTTTTPAPTTTTPAPTTTTPTPISYMLNCDFKLDLVDVGPIVNNEQTFILNITSNASATASDGSLVNTSLDWTIIYPGNFILTSGTTNMANSSASISHTVTFDSFQDLINFPVNVTGFDATVTYRFSDQNTYGNDEGICAPFD